MLDPRRIVEITGNLAREATSGRFGWNRLEPLGAVRGTPDLPDPQGGGGRRANGFSSNPTEHF